MCDVLFAEIKRSSKYYRQAKPGEVFEVKPRPRDYYCWTGGPGEAYRATDVNLYLHVEGNRFHSLSTSRIVEKKRWNSWMDDLTAA